MVWITRTTNLGSIAETKTCAHLEALFLLEPDTQPPDSVTTASQNCTEAGKQLSAEAMHTGSHMCDFVVTFLKIITEERFPGAQVSRA